MWGTSMKAGQNATVFETQGCFATHAKEGFSIYGYQETEIKIPEEQEKNGLICSRLLMGSAETWTKNCE